MSAVNLTVGLPIKRLEVLSITEYHGAGLLGKGTHKNTNFLISIIYLIYNNTDISDLIKYNCVLICAQELAGQLCLASSSWPTKWWAELMKSWTS